MKAVIITLLICFSAVLAGDSRDSYDRMITGLANVNRISRTEAEICANKTQASLEDMRLFEMTFDLPDDGITDRASFKRAACTLSCCAQTKGLMIGAKFQLRKIHELIDSTGIPKDAATPIHQAIDTCALDLRDATDECWVVRDFTKCLNSKLDEPPRIV